MSLIVFSSVSDRLNTPRASDWLGEIAVTPRYLPKLRPFGSAMMGQVLRRNGVHEVGCDDAFGIVGYKDGVGCAGLGDGVAQLVEEFACDGMGDFSVNAHHLLLLSVLRVSHNTHF